MLTNLVKKFKNHSLDEQQQQQQQVQFPPHRPITRNMMLTTTSSNRSGNPARRSTTNSTNSTSTSRQERNKVETTSSNLFNNHLVVVVDGGSGSDFGGKDSGTESDEELEKIETNSVRSAAVSQTSDYCPSQQSLSASCRSLHCDSPFFSDPESNNSFSCENVINNISSSIGGHCEMSADEFLPHHHYHTRQQFQRFLKSTRQASSTSSTSATTTTTNEDVSHKLDVDFQELNEKYKSSKSPANNFVQQGEETSSPLTAFAPVRNLVAEKRKWSRSRCSPSTTLTLAAAEEEEDVSVVSVSGCQVQGEVNTASTITTTQQRLDDFFSGARKTPVHLVAASKLESASDEDSPDDVDDNTKKSSTVACTKSRSSSSARKKRRLDIDSGGRPSLNFDKMREKMVSVNGISKSVGTNSNLKLNKTKSRNCNNVIVVGYQLRSSHDADCLFEPVSTSSPSVESTPPFSIGFDEN